MVFSSFQRLLLGFVTRLTLCLTQRHLARSHSIELLSMAFQAQLMRPHLLVSRYIKSYRCAIARLPIFQTDCGSFNSMEHSDVHMTDMKRSQLAPPCAACKMLRRRCGEKCLLAPYFPPDNIQQFITAHKVFGASYVTKTIQGLPMEQRADAVNSMVYEATARLRDPVYGCRGTICRLEQQVLDLQSQLALAQMELMNVRSKLPNLVPSVAESFDSTFATELFPVPGTSFPLETWYDNQQYNHLLWQSWKSPEHDPRGGLA